MKPYILIEGSNKNIEAFELKVASAIETGYIFVAELVSHLVQNEDKTYTVLFYQAMALDEEDDFEEEDFEEEESDEY